MLITRVAIDAAPLIKSPAIMHGVPAGAILDTVIRDIDNRVIHYRCTLQTPSNEFAQNTRYDWKEGGIINVTATGPSCLYYSEGRLHVLIPSRIKIEHYTFYSPRWVRTYGIENMLGPCCVYSSPEIHALVRAGSKVKEFVWEVEIVGKWKPSKLSLAASLNLIRRAAHHEVLPTNPIAVTSRTIGSTLEDHVSPNTEALVFHAYGPGWRDSWMILHWTFLAVSKKWVVSGVVLPHVIGMPL